MDLSQKENICVSIVLPVYNGEKNIENAIRSVLQQSYSNYELIVVDDGSTDKTMEVLKKYENEERIRIINKNNGGVSSARNVGLKYITGDYLMFLDSDDKLMEKCLAVLVDYVKRYKEMDLIVYGWQEQGEENIVRRLTDKAKIMDVEVCIENIIRTEYGCGGGYPWNKLWKVNTIYKKDGVQSFNEELILCEDKEWVVRLLIESNNVLIIPEVLYSYYVAEGEHLSKVDFNAVDKENDKKIMSFMKASIKIEKTVLKRKPQSKVARSAHRICMQSIIFVFYKTIKNKNDALFDQVIWYYMRYVKKQNKNISIKHWLMLYYININMFLKNNNFIF